MNTGVKHPLAKDIRKSDKRDIGSEPLTDFDARLWYGTIALGRPAVSLTGEMFLLPGSNSCLNVNLIQWPSILAAATSSCPRQAASRPARGTNYMTQMPAILLMILAGHSPFNIWMALLSVARYIAISLTLPA